MGLAKDSSVLTSVLSRKGKHASDGAAASERPGASAAHGSGGGAPGKVVSKREREAERERIREEWKKIIWWEVLYYDLCVSFCCRLPGCSYLFLVSQVHGRCPGTPVLYPGIPVWHEASCVVVVGSVIAHRSARVRRQWCLRRFGRSAGRFQFQCSA